MSLVRLQNCIASDGLGSRKAPSVSRRGAGHAPAAPPPPAPPVPPAAAARAAGPGRRRAPITRSSAGPPGGSGVSGARPALPEAGAGGGGGRGGAGAGTGVGPLPPPYGAALRGARPGAAGPLPGAVRAARDGAAGSWRRGAGFARRRSEAGRGEGRVKTNTLKGGEKGKKREKQGKKNNKAGGGREGVGSAWRAAPALAGQRAERRDGAAGGGQRAQEAAPPAGGGPGQRQRQVRAPRRARGGGTEWRRGSSGRLQRVLSGGDSAGSGDLRAPGGCRALGGRGSRAPISDLLRRETNPTVGSELSPLEAGAAALRPRLLRKRRSGAERGNFVRERAALRGQRPGGGVRAPGERLLCCLGALDGY